MARFIRHYEISIRTPQNELITIRPPFTAKFTITRNDLASANKTSLTILNLSPTNRAKIYKDRFTSADYWQMIIKAGYWYAGFQNQMGKIVTIFQGNIFEAYSYKQGTEWYTQIEGLDAQFDMQNSFTSTTIQKNTPQKNVIETVAKDLTNTTMGVVGSPGDGENKRGKALFGRTKDVLDSETNNRYFVDKETIHSIDNDEVLSDEVILLNSDLLKSTPKKRDTFLDCDCLFFPEAETAYICELRSKFESYNGQYKIVGFTHNVNVSGADCGDASSQIRLYTEAKSFQVVT